ncbi:hypothetical protein J2S49_000678 [Arcanobacterium wilhelmae]|uniref:Secreted protein n=1 Tax=Arcanobacterium wilhelmae TaxID=1803177 RepID=A0ABT9NA52_9ACTO|nr:hypothetical protein [Arcanobacterium wilhelmae]MDP9800602.1 hypothetical protein [Arcanobacterium wilhelmae]
MRNLFTFFAAVLSAICLVLVDVVPVAVAASENSESSSIVKGSQGIPDLRTLDVFGSVSDPTAQMLVGRELRKVHAKLRPEIRGQIPRSLNMQGADAPFRDLGNLDVSPQEIEVLETLPRVDERSAEVLIPDPETRKMFSVRVKNYALTSVLNGVAVSAEKNGVGASAVSHVTEDGDG